ncbi:TetR/AcrR family transcriptional regulator [Nocardia cyriacigeorgica]|uniref:TetR/AcrR family transcriptional regulator n=1 Tax=Nocardia cyriacigeorgica TaxID=135487 RepID=UPI001893CF06|nr:TetR/AcrR family transcriptional regulator [Nocardia cyriacigeorgica]MBF6440345.1 TetR/AcrR family transcriptional regulator [Nocardia cyriacigeorgica]
MPRRYDTTRRVAQAAGTRARILDAARDLFTTRGFVATTVADIADHAGVAAATVHAAGTKGTLLLDAVMREFTGGGAVLDTDELSAAFSDPNTGRALDAAATFLTAAHARSARLWAVVHTAAAIDATVANRVAELEHRRSGELLKAAGWFSAHGLAKPGDETMVSDVLAFITDSAAYQHFVIERGWSDDDYRAWLRNQLALVGGVAYSPKPASEPHKPETPEGT